MSSLSCRILDDFTSLAKANSMQLEDSTISKFCVAKEYSENKRINSIDFSEDGKYLLTSSDDDTIRLYDCEKGVQLREIFSKKYGVDLIKYTHARNTAIHTSTKENDFIRYLSLHDNKYLRYFTGHQQRVVSLCMSPADDSFLSVSLDATARLWDLRSEKPPALMKDVPTEISKPVANFDPEGLIFALGVDSRQIKFYDLRQFNGGPFSTNVIENKNPRDIKWESLNFSPDGKQLLVTTNVGRMYVLDAFSASPKHTLSFTDGPIGKPIEHVCEASYTPDSQYIISGSEAGCLHIWSANKGTKIPTVLTPPRLSTGPVQCVKFNPKYMMIGSASSKMTFWIPGDDSL